MLRLKIDNNNKAIYMTTEGLQAQLIKASFRLITLIGRAWKKGKSRNHWKGQHKNEAKWIYVKIYQHLIC